MILLWNFPCRDLECASCYRYDDLSKNYDCTQEEKESLDFEREDLQVKLHQLQEKLNEIEQEHDRIVEEKLSKIAELEQRESNLLFEINQLKSEQSKETEIGEMQVDGAEGSNEELLKRKYEKEMELLSEENSRLQQRCKDIEDLQRMLQEQSDKLDFFRQQVEEKAQLIEKYQNESKQFKQVLGSVLDTQVSFYCFFLWYNCKNCLITISIMCWSHSLSVLDV